MDAQIIIVGAGAAGLMAGIAAGRAGSQVLILDQKEKPGKKLYATGNGRCNYTNLRQERDCYRGTDPDFAMRAFQSFGLERTRRLFGELGILERSINGYLYPNSGQAKDVVAVLLYELDRLGAAIRCGEAVTQIRKEKNGFAVRTGEREYRSAKVILAAGGCASPKLGSDGSGYALAKSLGHSLIEPVPALVQLKSAENTKAVSGVRFFGAGDIRNSTGKVLTAEEGEFLFTDYGISGIPVMQMSRFAAKELQAGRKVRLTLNFLSDMTKEVCEKEITKRFSGRNRSATAIQALTGLVNEKLLWYVLKECGIKEEAPVQKVPRESVIRLAGLLQAYPLTINGTNSFENAQVCAGGVKTSQVTEQMESKLCGGLYLAGELLDIDGTCGGYNLQWAWTSGWIAGSSAAEGIRGQSGGSQRSEYNMTERHEKRT
ncbi:MAG: aminoacetone oxidase family FAD-binding enzyme [Lachnospiraceae bacterium]|nr:aminoacetone oxidase family FAD-binding enzyme [Lachnospiraceae bacterium]